MFFSTGFFKTKEIYICALFSFICFIYAKNNKEIIIKANAEKPCIIKPCLKNHAFLQGFDPEPKQTVPARNVRRPGTCGMGKKLIS